MAITSFARHIRWYRGALGSSPLVRVSDRLEALVVLAVLATALFTIPVAAHAGSELYQTGMRVTETQAHDRHAVEAVAVEGSVSLPTDFDSSASVRVQWHDGPRLRTERIITPGTLRAGESLTVWLNDAGKVVAAPLTATDARMSALGAAGTVWVLLVIGSALAAIVVRRRLDRSRDRAWEQALHLMAHNDDGWANRHP